MNTLSVEQALKHAKCKEVIHNIMNWMISCIRGIHNDIFEISTWFSMQVEVARFNVYENVFEAI